MNPGFRTVTRLASVLCLLSGLWLAGSARADVPPDTVTEVDPIDIPPEHDPLAHAFRRLDDRGGFYLRLSTNIGYHSTRLGSGPGDAGPSERARGFGTAFGVDLGGFVQPWLALHLDSTLGILWNGDIDRDLAIDEGLDNSVRILAYGVAPALTFFLPHTFFIKTAFGVGMATIKRVGRTNNTNPGFYMDLVLGKDLYVDDHFSFGLQMQIIYMRLGADSRINEARVQQYLWGVSFGFDSL
ncbi:MAG: hypothetical protein QM778_27095 [Myxococcales bacterium]